MTLHVKQDDEPGKLRVLFNEKVKPLFRSDKKWFWWNIGFFGVSTTVVATHGLGNLDWILEYLTKESPIDKALQKLPPPPPHT